MKTSRQELRDALTRMIESQDDPREPDHTREGIFVHHNCWKCKDGTLPCAQGHTLNCEYPHARND